MGPILPVGSESPPWGRDVVRVEPIQQKVTGMIKGMENLITLRSEVGPTLPAEVNCVAMPLLLICLGPFA